MSENGRRHAKLLLPLSATILLGFAATTASSAPITPFFGQAQLAYGQLGLFAPLDTQAGSPFFSPLGTEYPAPPPPSAPPATRGLTTLSYITTVSDVGAPRSVDPRPGDAIPEPAGALLFAAGFAFVALRSRRG